MRWPDIRPMAILHAREALIPAQVESLRRAFADGFAQGRPLVLHAGLPAPVIVPLPRRRREHTVECEGCGALVHPNEPACTYCTRVPRFVDLVDVDPISDRVDTIDITTLNDESPRHLFIPQPARDSR